MGIAVHEYLEKVPEVGREQALAEVPGFARDFCEALDIEALPTDYEKFSQEMWVAYYPDTDTAKVVKKGTRPDDAIICVLDVVGLSSDHVYIEDYKTGFAYIGEVRDHWQMRVCALAAARALGRDRVRVVIRWLREDGTHWTDSHEFNAMELDSICVQVLDILVALRRMNADPDKIVCREGEHCRYCPAFVSCPAKVALAARLVESPATVAGDIVLNLTPENAAEAERRCSDLEDLIGKTRKQIQDYAREHPFDMGDGRVYEEREVKRKSLDGATAWRVVKEIHGEETAREAIEWKMSQEGLKKALRPKVGEGVTLKALVDEVMDEMVRQDGVKVRVTKSVRAYKKKKERIAPPA